MSEIDLGGLGHRWASLMASLNPKGITDLNADGGVGRGWGVGVEVKRKREK